jgi:hypothetical protein
VPLCWTKNRINDQELLLEDVNGDGFVDIAFRASKRWKVPCKTSGKTAGAATSESRWRPIRSPARA